MVLNYILVGCRRYHKMFRLLSNYAPNFESNELVLQNLVCHNRILLSPIVLQKKGEIVIANNMFFKINKTNIAERDSFFLWVCYHCKNLRNSISIEIGSVEPQKLRARKSNRFTCLRSLPIVSETIRVRRLRLAGHCARHNESAEDSASKVLL